VRFWWSFSRRHSAALGLHLDGRASSHTYRRCMLGLRPRLRPRPSLLDLARKTNFDELPLRPSTPHDTGTHPKLVPLPQSPVLHPHDDADDVETPPPHSPLDAAKQHDTTDKMPPVSDWLGGAPTVAMADDGGVAETAAEDRR
jgi:hypothetical protein